MGSELDSIRQALRDDDRVGARRLLTPLLKENATADVWVLAAHAVDARDRKVAFLKRAIALDPWHNEANRLLLKWEEVKPLSSAHIQEPQIANATIFEKKPLEESIRRGPKKSPRRIRWGCVLPLVMSAISAFLTLSMLGMVPGAVALGLRAIGGPERITEINGIPIESLPNAAAIVPASSSGRASNQEVNVLDHGLLHEYTFDAVAGEEYVGYIQFMSLNAYNASRGVVVMTPDGLIATRSCRMLGDRGIMDGASSVTFECAIDQTGTWKVRILGLEGVSVGAYFFGMQQLDAVPDWDLSR